MDWAIKPGFTASATAVLLQVVSFFEKVRDKMSRIKQNRSGICCAHTSRPRRCPAVGKEKVFPVQ